MYIFVEHMCAKNKCAEYMCICGEHEFANLLIALWCIHTQLVPSTAIPSPGSILSRRYDRIAEQSRY